MFDSLGVCEMFVLDGVCDNL